METFLTYLRKHQLLLNKKQIQQFSEYFEYLHEWNQHMNLTAISEEKEVYFKHFFDSLTLSFYFDFSKITTLLDVGSGAGFPSIPLKICFPHLHISIIDALGKRVQFLNGLVEKLKLVDVLCYHGRAEEFARKDIFREQFEVVTARAVARCNVLAEWCLPFVKKDGTWLVMKGPQVEEELKEGEGAIQKLGGEIQTIHNYELPFEYGKRSQIYVKKTRHTSKAYPRAGGAIKRQPLS